MIRFQPGPIFSGIADRLLGAYKLAVARSTSTRIWAAPVHCWWTCPAQRLPILWLRLGKDRKAYLVNRDNLGGISCAYSHQLRLPAARSSRRPLPIETNRAPMSLSAPTTTATLSLRFPHYCNQSASIDIPGGWNVNRASGGCGSPFVTSTDGTNNMIVWVVGTEDHQTARRPAIARL